MTIQSKRTTSGRRPYQSLRQSAAAQQHLMPWKEIAREMFRRHGIKMTRTRVWQICQEAEAKIARAIGGEI
jgi:hypothetical protein